jgi:SPX domain protein involved in polyphosphate accumulation
MEYANLVATLDASRLPQEKLKAKLSQAVAHPTSTTSRRSFQSTFESELRWIATLVSQHQENLEREAKALFLRADALANALANGPTRPESQATLRDLQVSTQRTVADCLALQEFFTNSRQTLAEMAAVADERLAELAGVKYASLVHQSLPKAHLNSSLVCVVSDIYQALRLAQDQILNQGPAASTTLWEAPSSFQRSTTKYWVKDENLTTLMMTCATEAPLLVYGWKGPLTSTTQPRDAQVSDGDKLWDSLATRITSIYFDSADMSLYKERLARAQGAKLLRVRWYGTTMPTADKIIFVELKTHHEKWVGNKSVKERASIQERDMADFLAPVPWTGAHAEAMILRAKPSIKAEALAKATDLLLRMHNLVVKHKLTACVRSVYARAAFQSSKSNGEWLTWLAGRRVHKFARSLF